MSLERSIALSLVVIAISLTVSCGREQATPRPGASASDKKLLVLAESFRQSNGTQGFVCGVDDANRLFCMCDDDKGDTDPWSCVGMERMCGLLGTGSICNPSTNICACHARQ